MDKFQIIEELNKQRFAYLFFDAILSIKSSKQTSELRTNQIIILIEGIQIIA